MEKPGFTRRALTVPSNDDEPDCYYCDAKNYCPNTAHMIGRRLAFDSKRNVGVYFLDTCITPFSIRNDRLCRSARSFAATRHGVQPNFIGSD